METPSFIFGGNTGSSYEDLQRRRKVLDALLARTSGAPQNVGEGIFSLAQGLTQGFQARQLKQDEAAGQKAQAGIWGDLTGAMAPSAAPMAPAGAGAGFGGATGAIADSSTPAASGLKPAEAEGYATKYYIDKGLAPYQAAGMVGNLIQESSLNTGARNPGDGRDGSDSIGIMQANGDRARNLMAFAKGTGRDVSNLDTQLDFTLHEMGMGNPEWKKLPGFGAESRAGQMLRSAKDVREATAAGISYERPQGWSAKNPFAGHGWDNRIGHAQRLAGGKWDQAAVAPVQPAPVQVASADPSFMPGGAVDAAPGALSPEDQQRYNERISVPTPSSVPYSGPGAETGGPMSVYDDKGIRMENAGSYGRLPPPAAAPAPDFLTSGLPATTRPVEMPAGPLPEPGQAPVQTAAIAAPSVAPMPPAQTVAANPVPPSEPAIAMDDPRFDPRTSPEMRQAMISGDFDGLGFKSAASNVAAAMPQGMPSAPAAPTGPVGQVAAAVNSTAQAQGVDPRKLLGIISNPAASDQQRSVASALLERQMKQNAPMSPKDSLELQKTQLEIDQLRNPQLKPGDQLARERFEWEQKQAGVQKPTADIQEFQYAKDQGYKGDFVQFQLDQKKAGASSVTVGGGDSGKFFEAADKKRGEAVADIAAAGDTAQRSLLQIGELEARLGQIGTGASANMRSIAGNFGIPVDGVDDIQAATALINQLVPAQRPPGSGSMSDADVVLFKQSLPRIINSPDGNSKILGAMKGIAQYDAQRGQIANQVLNREITPAQGQEMMNKIPNPLASINKPPVAQGDVPPPGKLWQGTPEAWKFVPAEQRKLFE